MMSGVLPSAASPELDHTPRTTMPPTAAPTAAKRTATRGTQVVILAGSMRAPSRAPSKGNWNLATPELPKCLAFKGGYCGVADRTTKVNCPVGSAWVKHTDGTNYCFVVCADKPDCNVNRPADATANCSGTATFTDAESGKRACVPPS